MRLWFCTRSDLPVIESFDFRDVSDTDSTHVTKFTLAFYRIVLNALFRIPATQDCHPFASMCALHLIELYVYMYANNMVSV